MEDLHYRSEQLAPVVSQTLAMKAALHSDLQVELAVAALPRRVEASFARVPCGNAWDVGPSTLASSRRYGHEEKNRDLGHAELPGEHEIMLPVSLDGPPSKSGLVAAKTSADARWLLARNTPRPQLPRLYGDAVKESSQMAALRNLPHQLGLARETTASSLEGQLFEDDPVLVSSHISHSCEVDGLPHSARRSGLLHVLPRGWRDRQPWSRLCRVDGENDLLSNRNFRLMDGGTMLVRRDPTAAPALVLCNRPLTKLPHTVDSSHLCYLELRVRNIFRAEHQITALAPELVIERPEQFQPLPEGCVTMGVTAVSPSQIRTSTASVQDVPHSWCLSTEGFFIKNMGESSVVGKRLRPPPISRQSPISTAANGSNHESHHAVQRVVGTPAVLSEGTTIALLVKPCGGVFLLVDGVRCCAVPDARVPMDGELYAIIQVSGCVRSIQALPGVLHFVTGE